MGLFGRKNVEEVEDDFVEETDNPRRVRRQFKDLNPENRRARKEILKQWGKSERLSVLIVLLLTVLTSGMLALTARNFKLPRLPQLKLNISELNPFKEQVIVVGNKGSKISQKKIENAKRLFRDAADNHSGIYAFYIYDLKGDYYYGVNHQEIMQAASLIKLPVMYMAMKDDQDKTLIEAMGKRSDNNAFIKMINILGKENVNKTISDLGMAHTSLSENTTTPEEVGLFFKKLYKNELLDKDKTKELEGYMANTIFENWLKLGIPDDITLIHKYGREVHCVNDAGVITGNNPFVIVIMTDGVIEKEADELFPKLTKLLYDNHIDN